MDAREARAAVNRRNAQKSTGPKSAEGKARSRCNALRHGLTATVLDPEREPIEPMGPESAPDWRIWLTRQVERVQAQIDRGQRIEAKQRDLAAYRAEAFWEDDRQLNAEEVGSALGRDPSRVVARLEQTPQGCEWLMKRWGLLANAAEVNQAWTDEQTRLAFDLLGIPDEGRVGPPGATVDPATDSGRSLVALARSALVDLETRRDRVAESDELEQMIAANDCRDLPTAELARLRRYDLALQKRLQWLLAELKAPAPTLVSPTTPASLDETKPELPETKPELPETKPELPETKPPVPIHFEPEAPRKRPDLDRIHQKKHRKNRRQQ